MDLGTMATNGLQHCISMSTDEKCATNSFPVNDLQQVGWTIGASSQRTLFLMEVINIDATS